MRSLQREAARFPILLVAIILVSLNVVAWVSTDEHWLPFAIVSLVALLFTIVFSYAHAKRIVQPLSTLMPAMDEQGRLVLDGKPSMDRPKELETLTRVIGQIAEKQKRDSEARQKLERVRSEFLGNVSHELRTPIFAVQGFIETLLDGAIDDPAVNRDFLERARVQSERLNSLLNDLIDISRIESGEMRMSFRAFDIQPFLRDFTTEMQHQARQKGMELYFTGNIRAHQEVRVYADKERIKQVLINLVDNAIKYSGEGASIKLELLSNEPGSKLVTIRVTDTGVGISEEHLSRLFERFYRVDKGRARSSPGGTGLGLAIVKHIVEAHHGHIRVTSAPGKGSTFQFTLQSEPF